MPESIEQTLAIINSPDSKLTDITPIIYRLPDDLPEHETRMRYLDQTSCASRTIRLWLKMEYGDKWHMQTTEKDDSDVFALVREPRIRWWSGIRSWMYNLPWYAWWQNEQLMEKFFPHFKRFTNFCRKHKLRQYGPLFWEKNHRYIDRNLKAMEDKGRSQLERFLKDNKKWQDKLDAFLEPDYVWWKKVDMQE